MNPPSTDRAAMEVVEGEAATAPPEMVVVREAGDCGRDLEGARRARALGGWRGDAAEATASIVRKEMSRIGGPRERERMCSYRPAYRPFD